MQNGTTVSSLAFPDGLISDSSRWHTMHQDALLSRRDERKERTHWSASFSKERTVNHYKIISVHKVESIWAFKWSSRRSNGPWRTGQLDLVLATTDGRSDRNFIIRNKWLRLPPIASCHIKHERVGNKIVCLKTIKSYINNIARSRKIVSSLVVALIPF